MRNEYRFFRGTADLFWLLARECCADWLTGSCPPVLLHGDVHLGNIGTYQGPGVPGEDIRFGLVDLDEAVGGPFLFDLLRAAVALRLAAESQRVDLTDDTLALCVGGLVAGYAEALRDPPDDKVLASRYPVVASLTRKARQSQIRSYVNKFVQRMPLRFRPNREKNGRVSDILRPVNNATREQVVDALWWYMANGTTLETRCRYRFSNIEQLRAGVLDVADWVRVGSSGSQGLRKYLVLLDAPFGHESDPIIIQLKEEPPPAAARAGLATARRGPQRAADVAQATRRINPSAPWLTGYTRIGSRGFLVKTRDPWGKELSVTDVRSPESLAEMAGLIGQLLGRSHRLWWDQTGTVESIAKAEEAISASLPELVKRSGKISACIKFAYQDLLSDPTAGKARAAASSILDETPVGRKTRMPSKNATVPSPD